MGKCRIIVHNPDSTAHEGVLRINRWDLITKCPGIRLDGDRHNTTVDIWTEHDENLPPDRKPLFHSYIRVNAQPGDTVVEFEVDDTIDRPYTPENVFDFFDDFDVNPLDNGWQVGGLDTSWSPTISNSICEIPESSGTNGIDRVLYRSQTIQQPFLIVIRHWLHATSGGPGGGVWLATSPMSFSEREIDIGPYPNGSDYIIYFFNFNGNTTKVDFHSYKSDDVSTDVYIIENDNISAIINSIEYNNLASLPGSLDNYLGIDLVNDGGVYYTDYIGYSITLPSNIQSDIKLSYPIYHIPKPHLLI